MLGTEADAASTYLGSASFIRATWTCYVLHAILFMLYAIDPCLLVGVVVDGLSFASFISTTWAYNILHAILFMINTKESCLLTNMIVSRPSFASVKRAESMYYIYHTILLMLMAIESCFLIGVIKARVDYSAAFILTAGMGNVLHIISLMALAIYRFPLKYPKVCLL